MAGFRNETIWGKNVDFSGTNPPAPTMVTDGQLLIASTAAPNIKVGTLTSTNNSVSITYASPNINLAIGSSIFWSSVGAGGALLVHHGYIVASGALSFSLPTGAGSSAVGDMIAILLDAGTSWTITMAGTQRIRFGNIQTSLGGTLASTASGDAVTLVCTVADTMWAVVSSVGNITWT